MAKPYSNDLRERVVEAVASGLTCREVAGRFNVSVASVVKWSQRYRATGSAAPAKMGGYRKRLLEPHRDLVLDKMAAKPDMTLKEMVAELAEHGIETCAVSVWRLLRAAGLRYKKSPVRHRADQGGYRPTARAVEEISGAA